MRTSLVCFVAALAVTQSGPAPTPAPLTTTPPWAPVKDKKAIDFGAAFDSLPDTAAVTGTVSGSLASSNKIGSSSSSPGASVAARAAMPGLADINARRRRYTCRGGCLGWEVWLGICVAFCVVFLFCALLGTAARMDKVREQQQRNKVRERLNKMMATVEGKADVKANKAVEPAAATVADTAITSTLLPMLAPAPIVETVTVPATYTMAQPASAYTYAAPAVTEIDKLNVFGQAPAVQTVAAAPVMQTAAAAPVVQTVAAPAATYAAPTVL